MSVKLMKLEAASGGWDMKVLYNTDYDPPRYIGHEMKVD